METNSNKNFADYKKAYRSALITLRDAAQALSEIDGMTCASLVALSSVAPYNSDRTAYYGAKDAYAEVQYAARRLEMQERYLDDAVTEIEDMLR